MSKVIRTSVFNWSDGKTVSCYVWTHDKDIKWYVIDLNEAQNRYPKLSRLASIRQVAKDRFQDDR